MTWLFVGATIASLALADVAIKHAGQRISPSWATLVVAVAALLLPAVWFAIDRRGRGIELDPAGMAWASTAGVALSAAAGLLFLIFDRGMALSVATPIVRAGGFVIAAVLGIALLGEHANVQYVAGMLLTVVGILLIAAR